jgi:hypothetical protein
MRLSALSAAILIAASANAQVTVTTAPANAQQAYYSLANGVVANHALADWDLAFELTGITGSILLNTAKGHKLYKAPYAVAQWSSIDTTGLAATWPQQHNSESNWSAGAFNRGLTANPFDLGWGIYNFVTHNIAGDSCFVLQLNGGAWKKFKVDGFASATNSFTFTWANLDGSDQQSGNLVRSAFPGKNFGYYNLSTNSTADLEPSSADWDLLFTKYMGFVTQPFPAMYPVAGVLQNVQVEAVQVDGVPTADATYWGETFSADINIIGFDWKNFNQGTFQWEYAQDRTYFVKDRAGDIFKLVFTAYGGSANGNFTFNQELVGQASVNEAGVRSTFVIAPNPATSIATLIIAADADAARLSIIDLNGRVVMQQQITGLHGLVQRPIDVSALPAGLYIARMQGEGLDSASRFAKE